MLSFEGFVDWRAKDLALTLEGQGRNRTIWPSAIGAMALAALACAAPRQPWALPLPHPGVRPAAHIDEIASYPRAAVTIAALVERELGLPPFPVTFRFYPRREAFEAALRQSGYSEALASATARTMTAVGGFRTVLLNEANVDALSWPARVRMLAHELGHSVQYELAGGRRGASDQWLREGFAEWLAMRVLERLRAVSLDAARTALRGEFSASDRRRAPRLDDMATFEQWVALGGRRDIAPYAQAFLAADALVEQHGTAAVITYFRRFAEFEDRRANFRAAFGQDLEGFEATVDARLGIRRSLASQPAAVVRR